MPRSRLPVSRLKRRSTWPKLSRASQLARLIREIPAQLVPGRPKPPAGLAPVAVFEFEAACDELEGLQILAESDGDLIVHLAEVRRAKNDDAVAAVEQVFRDRLQFVPSFYRTRRREVTPEAKP